MTTIHIDSHEYQTLCTQVDGLLRKTDELESALLDSMRGLSRLPEGRINELIRLKNDIIRRHTFMNQTLAKPIIEQMVDRFLGWKLPENFSPDCGISFKRTYNDHLLPVPSKFEPTGTNLLDAEQARKMIEHISAPQIEHIRKLESLLLRARRCGALTPGLVEEIDELIP